jgi:hypothetical protein
MPDASKTHDIPLKDGVNAENMPTRAGKTNAP